MKKAYTKPVFSCEYFEVNTHIAAGCVNTVSFGPYDPTDPTRSVCRDYVDMFGYKPANVADGHRGPQNGNFHEGACDCYLTAVQRGIFTS